MEEQTAQHYWWGDKCESWVLVDTQGLSVKRESMPGGAREQFHFHANAQQYFFILKGTATFYLEDVRQVVEEEKGLHIQPGVKHCIANETSHPLNFLVISQPTTNEDRIERLTE